MPESCWRIRRRGRAGSGNSWTPVMADGKWHMAHGRWATAVAQGFSPASRTSVAQGFSPAISQLWWRRALALPSLANRLLWSLHGSPAIAGQARRRSGVRRARKARLHHREQALSHPVRRAGHRRARPRCAGLRRGQGAFKYRILGHRSSRSLGRNGNGSAEWPSRTCASTGCRASRAGSMSCRS